METFGLLDFLLPLLDFTKKTTQNEIKQNGDYSPDFPVQNTQNTARLPTETQENPPLLESEKGADFSPQNAILAFYQAHEKRAKRTKK